MEAIDEYLDEKLETLKTACGIDYPRVLIGSSGSFDTLAQMCAESFKTSRLDEGDTNYTFSMHEYMQISQKMLSSNFEDRLNTPGMIPLRADMIVMACIEINYIIKRFGIRLLQQCNYALKEGLYFHLENNPAPWQKSSL
jgi:exopolyphosphatase/guanosine-5'-triphosphate,3'-diphosphate pyrophosphatase